MHINLTYRKCLLHTLNHHKRYMQLTLHAALHTKIAQPNIMISGHNAGKKTQFYENNLKNQIQNSGQVIAKKIRSKPRFPVRKQLPASAVTWPEREETEIKTRKHSTAIEVLLAENPIIVPSWGRTRLEEEARASILQVFIGSIHRFLGVIVICRFCKGLGTNNVTSGTNKAVRLHSAVKLPVLHSSSFLPFFKFLLFFKL